MCSEGQTEAECDAAQRESNIAALVGGAIAVAVTVAFVYMALDDAIGPDRALISRRLRLLFSIIAFPLAPVTTFAAGFAVQPPWGPWTVVTSVVGGGSLMVAWALALRRVVDRRH